MRIFVLFSLLPTPYSLLPTPYSLFPVPCSLFPLVKLYEFFNWNFRIKGTEDPKLDIENNNWSVVKIRYSTTY
ncbi:MAG: hypothetical protein F6K56_04925 [Moorea sp. SIO3G5]|nr:hypothetical protein [Moorena sp. SIO3G5]